MANPLFSPTSCCGAGSVRVYRIALGSGAPRIAKYACAPGLSRHASTAASRRALVRNAD